MEFVKWLEIAREKGKLKEGKKCGYVGKSGKSESAPKRRGHVSWQYAGELNDKGQECGHGSLKYIDGAQKGYFDYTGTFYKGKFHGVGT